jgi:23S rRNA pseudouridine1911/1915/1917 synthase
MLSPNAIQLELSPADLGKRIDVFLAEHLEGFSRTRIQDLIESGCVACEAGAIRRSNFRLRSLQAIEVRTPPPLESRVIPQDLPIEILYEDDDLAVVNKPAGISTHPTPVKTEGTLVNALLYHLKDLSGVGGVLRPGIVHRLDLVTSGLLVVAKNQIAHERLSDQFRQRLITKTYRAVCLGADPGEAGAIEGLIHRHPARRRKMTLGEEGRTSKTDYRRVAANPPLFGLLLFPTTGRTHQIRVHLESIRCPIVLDELYGYDSRRWPRREILPALRSYPGILLHAERLEFTHPSAKEAMNFHTPPPPLFEEIWRLVFGRAPGMPDAAP